MRGRCVALMMKRLENAVAVYCTNRNPIENTIAVNAIIPELTAPSSACAVDTEISFPHAGESSNSTRGINTAAIRLARKYAAGMSQRGISYTFRPAGKDQ